MAQIWHKCHGEKMCARKALIDLTPRWRNWETRRTQNPILWFFLSFEITFEIKEMQASHGFLPF